MMEEFGMKFDHDTPVDYLSLLGRLRTFGEEVIEEHPGMKVIAIPYNPSAKFYVHPDSVPVLKAQAGDVLYGPCGGELFNITEHVIFNSDMSIEGAQNSINDSDWRIIMRWVERPGEDSGHVAFHRPKVEAG
jgi:hypothetical protein